MADPFIGQIMAVPYQFAPYQWSFCQGQELQTGQNQALYSLLGYVYGGNNNNIFNLPDLRGRVIVGAGTSGIPGLNPLNPGAKGGAAQETLTASQVPLLSHTHSATFSGTGGGGSPTASGNASLPVTGTLSNTAVSVNGNIDATTNSAQQSMPQSGWTLGDTGGFPIYADGTGGSDVTLAQVTSTGNVVSNAVTGTAAGPVSLTVSGTLTGGTVTVGPAGQPSASAPIAIMPPYLALYNIISMAGIYPTRE
jgi:microcystin-dependent protein